MRERPCVTVGARKGRELTVSTKARGPDLELRRQPKAISRRIRQPKKPHRLTLSEIRVRDRLAAHSTRASDIAIRGALMLAVELPMQPAELPTGGGASAF